MNRMTVSRRTFLKSAAALAMVGCASWPVAAAFLDGPFSPLPGSASAQFYAARQSDVESLIARVRTGTTETRLGALNELSNSFHEEALNQSLGLVKDIDTAIAAKSAHLLSNSLAMVGSVAIARETHPTSSPARQSIDAAIKALREVVEHDRRGPVRSVAAQTLARLGDDDAAKSIARLVENGEIPGLEALKYFSFLPEPDRSAYLKKCLDSDSPEVQIKAVNLLASYPDNQIFVRNLASGQHGTDVYIRMAGIWGLSMYDATFPSYGLSYLGADDQLGEYDQRIAEAVLMSAWKTKMENPSLYGAWRSQLDEELERKPAQPYLNEIRDIIDNHHEYPEFNQVAERRGWGWRDEALGVFANRRFLE